jgi:glucose/arabinose dehydrogenase
VIVLVTGDGEAREDLVGTAPRGERDGTTAAGAAQARESVRLKRIGRFDSPLYVTAPPGDRKRLFVVEQGGRVRLLLNGRRVKRPFLDLTSLVKSGGEQGLLSIAFAPDYSRSGRFYVDYTDRDGNTRVQELRRSKRSPNRASRSSRRQVLFVDQPFSNHNGGNLVFGPDGYLYIGLGDGGSGGDPMGNSQDLGTLLGKMLRIDPRPSDGKPYGIPPDNPFVNMPRARPEIWAYGLRNPWRYAFDRETGDLWIGDVGQSSWEEIDLQRVGSPGGENYGWNRMEGDHAYDGGTPPPDYVPPMHEYSSAGPACAVTGGYVYRGTLIPELRGAYLFADFCLGRIMALRRAGDGPQAEDLGIRLESLSSFGEDRRGELYAMSLSGGLFRIEAR